MFMRKFKQIKNILKSFGVVLIGFLATLAFFELSLMVFGQLRVYLQEQSNKVNAADEFVILALGESTTMPMIDSEGYDFSWPAQLEAALNQEDLGVKIKVVNKGWSGINTAGILDELPQNLEQYQPDLVVSMMGINDHGRVEYEAAAGIDQESPKAKFRVYRLAKFLVNNFKEKINQTGNSTADETKVSCSSAKDCIESADKLKSEAEMVQAREFWKKALDYEPLNLVAMRNLAQFYLDRRQMDQAAKYYRLLEEHYSQHSFIQHDLGWFDLLDQRYNEAKVHFKRVIAEEPLSASAYSGLVYSVQDSPTAVAEFEEIIKEIQTKDIQSVGLFEALAEQGQRMGYNPNRFHFTDDLKVFNDDPYALVSIARYYMRYEDWDKAEQFYLKSLESPQAGSLPRVELMELYRKTGRVDSIDQKLKEALIDQDMFVYNYRQLHQILNEKDIPLIAVQYPVRSVKPLEIIFQDLSNVWTVDNELSFKEEMERYGYEHLFVDYFAGDFGHCSQAGNQLLMNNIKEVILSHWSEIQRDPEV